MNRIERNVNTEKLNEGMDGSVRIVNLCEHDIRIRDINGDSLIVEASYTTPSAKVSFGSDKKHIQKILTEADEMPEMEIQIHSPANNVYNVPEPRKGTIYVVPAPVAVALKRPDVMSLGPKFNREDPAEGSIGLLQHADEPDPNAQVGVKHAKTGSGRSVVKSYK